MFFEKKNKGKKQQIQKDKPFIPCFVLLNLLKQKDCFSFFSFLFYCKLRKKPLNIVLIENILLTL